MYLSGCSDATVAGPADLLVKEERDAFDLMSVPAGSRAASFSRSLPAAEGLEESIAVPGVLGVLADKPKDAKAPEPRPKADEAPGVGEATLVVVKGVMPLSEDLALGVLSPPYRLLAEKVRDPSGLPFSLLVLEFVREFLLELRVQE